MEAPTYLKDKNQLKQKKMFNFFFNVSWVARMGRNFDDYPG